MNYLPVLDIPLLLKSWSFEFSGELKWCQQDFFTTFWKPQQHFTYIAKGHWTQQSQGKEFPDYLESDC